MRINDLLRDVTKASAGVSRRAQQIQLVDMLRQRHGEGAISFKGVEGWFSRGVIPGPWLVRIAALPERPIDLTRYI